MCCPTNCEIFVPVCEKNTIVSFIEIALNLKISLGSIFTFNNIDSSIPRKLCIVPSVCVSFYSFHQYTWTSPDGQSDQIRSDQSLSRV